MDQKTFRLDHKIAIKGILQHNNSTGHKVKMAKDTMKLLSS